MKLTSEHQTQLKIMIDKVIQDYRELQQSNDLASLHKFYQDKCVGAKTKWENLFMWSMLYSVKYSDREQWFKEVYEYANDDHIYTALKQTMKDYMS